MNETCDACAYPLQRHEAFRVLGEGTFCGRCWAQRLSLETRTDVGHLEVAPVVLEDSDGNERQFHFMYNPRTPSLSMFELDDEHHEVGFKFRVYASAGEDGAALVGRLLAKARAALASPQLQPSGASRYTYAFRGDVVQGWVRCDLAATRERGESVPRISIDGHDFSWEEFGRMLMEHEGWPFRLLFLGDE